MSELLPGDVILTRSNSVVGSLIRFGERARFAGWPAALHWLIKFVLRISQPDELSDPWWANHAAVYIGDGQLIEALADGLTLSPVSKYSQSIHVPLAGLRPDVTDTDRAQAVGFARTQLARHDRYGWLSIASIVVQLLTPLRLDLSWDGALICSAFAGQCLEHAGVLLPTRSSLTTMPADLAAMAAHAALPIPVPARGVAAA